MAWIAYTDADTDLVGKSPIIKFLGEETHNAVSYTHLPQGGARTKSLILAQDERWRRA